MSSFSSGMFGTMNPMSGSSVSPTMYSPLSGGSSLPSISGSMQNPTAGNSVNGSTPSYGGVQLSSPSLPNFSGSGNSISDLTGYQNQANQANASRFNQGVGVLAGGYNQGLGSISQAMDTSQQYANSNQQQVNNQAGAFSNQMNSQLATGGLGDAMGTMSALPQRTQALATQNINELANSRQAGLLQNAGSLTAQGGQGLANYMGSANIQAPNQQLYTGLEQQASQQQALQKQRTQAQAASMQQAVTQADNYLNNQGTGVQQPNPYASQDATAANWNTNPNSYYAGSDAGSAQQQAGSSSSPYADMGLQQLMNIPVNLPNTPQSQLQGGATTQPSAQQSFVGADGRVYDQWGNTL